MNLIDIFFAVLVLSFVISIGGMLVSLSNAETVDVDNENF